MGFGYKTANDLPGGDPGEIYIFGDKGDENEDGMSGLDMLYFLDEPPMDRLSWKKHQI